MLFIIDKPLVQYAAEEAIAAGIDTMVFVAGRNKRAIEEGRPIDAAGSWADNSLATRLFNWVPKFSLEDMFSDVWNWATNNPNGY